MCELITTTKPGWIRPFSYKIAQQKREHEPIINTVQQGATPRRRPMKQVSLPAALHHASGRVSARVESKARPPSNRVILSIHHCAPPLVSLIVQSGWRRAASSAFVTSGQMAGFGAELLDCFSRSGQTKKKKKMAPQFCSARQGMLLSLGWVRSSSSSKSALPPTAPPGWGGRQPGKQTLPANRSPTMVKKMDRTKRT